MKFSATLPVSLVLTLSRLASTYSCSPHTSGLLLEPTASSTFKYEVIKNFSKHCLHSRGLNGEIISIELAGSLDTGVLSANGIKADDIAKYQRFWTDFAFTKLDPREGAQFISIMDMRGTPLRRIASPTMLSIVQAQSEVFEQQLHRRCKKVLVVSNSRVLGPTFSAIRRMLPGQVAKLIEFVSEDDLTKYIAKDQLPEHLGGTSRVPLGESAEELALRAHMRTSHAKAHTQTQGQGQGGLGGWGFPDVMSMTL